MADRNIGDPIPLVGGPFQPLCNRVRLYIQKSREAATAENVGTNASRQKPGDMIDCERQNPDVTEHKKI